uniref:UPAR/Ly6 domain-containing protein n=1 Tax=Anopheles funestus TaxID=62324 RepID=A0A182RKJ3_ANOFN
MASLQSIVFVVQVILTFVPNITTLESNATGAQSNTTHCNTCWSLTSSGQCQNTSKSEPCSPEQLDSTMNKMRLIHAPTTEQSISGSTMAEHPLQQYRCFTLSASSGTGDSKKVFYAKGCTTVAGDLCASWTKEKSATCTTCTGNNCNAATPMEVSHSASIKLNNKNCTSSNSNRVVAINSSFSWMVGITLLSSVLNY